VLAETRAAREAGYPEVVITGTNLAAYGRDLERGPSLAELMEGLEALPGGRLRLSSLEPDDSLLPALRRMAQSRKWCRHLHLALQHGADPILKAMGRPYDIALFRSLAGQAASTIPGLALGLDVIVGFPGETEALFELSLSEVKALPFSHLHVFTWSPRPGTPAARMGDRVGVESARTRSRKLRELGAGRLRDFARQQAGSTLSALVERRRDRHTGLLKGLTDNYLRILLEGPDSLMGKLVECRLEPADGEMILGRDIHVMG